MTADKHPCNWKKLLPYWAGNAAGFYLLPLLIRDTGSAMLVILAVIPLVCFITALLLGKKHSLNWLYTLVVLALFTPTIFIFYNSSAWIYLLYYGAVVVAGQLVGKLIYECQQNAAK